MAGQREQGQEQKVFPLPHTIRLQEPIPFGKDETINEIVFQRRLKAKDLMGIKVQDMTFDDMLKIISRMTVQSMAIIKELDGVDFMEASEVVNSFLPNGAQAD